MLALEVIGILGVLYGILVAAVIRTRVQNSDTRQKKASPAATGGAW